jgi:hypothetical protein
MAMAVARVQQKALMGERRDTSFKMVMHFGPSRREPSRTKAAVSKMAVLYCMVPVATPVPKMVAELFAPRLQPMETALIIFHIIYIYAPDPGWDTKGRFLSGAPRHGLSHSHINDLHVVACVLNNVTYGCETGQKVSQHLSFPEALYPCFPDIPE